MGSTCKPMAVSFHCMTKSTTSKKKIIKGEKKRKERKINKTAKIVVHLPRIVVEKAK